MRIKRVSRTAGVFINVPFDLRYRKLFRALVFAVIDCGFTPRCALESDDGSQVRIEKLYSIIETCRYGIHDLSRVQLDSANRLPRFNMPLELGMFLGAKRFGDNDQRRKSCLILERDRYRFQKFCSDIAGQDVREHGNEVEKAMVAARDWMRSVRSTVPSFPRLRERYLLFNRDLPRMCRDQGLRPGNLTFVDLRTLMNGWRAENPSD